MYQPSSPTSKVMLSVQCKNLIALDTFSQSDPMAVLFSVDPKSRRTTEIGRTEWYKDNANPTFTKTFIVDYRFEQVQLFKIGLYDIDSKSNDLRKHDFIGEMLFNLGELLGSNGMAVTKRLLNPKKPKRKNGMCTILAEECDAQSALLHLRIQGIKLDKKDFFGKSDPYLIFYRQQIEGSKWIKVHQTEFIKNTLYPKWKPFTINTQILCGNDFARKIKIECYDWNRNGKPDLIGETFFTVNSLQKSDGKKIELIEPRKKRKKRKYKNSGVLNFVNVKIEELPTFLSYIHGGCEINMITAIDFTGSNGNPKQPNSLHYFDAYTVNDYQNAISSCGSILAEYDSDQMFPAFGFGAKISNQVSHCFPLNGNVNNPEVNGVRGILQAYNNVFNWPNFRLWGPTNFSPIINSVANIARQAEKTEGQKYFVLLFITDGEITDMEETRKAIVNAADLPISIVIVGVGPADFTKMEILDGDDIRLSYRGKKASRDIVQFVPFREFKNQGPEVLARETLEEIPDQLLSYFKSKGVKPNPPVRVNVNEIQVTGPQWQNSQQVNKFTQFAQKLGTNNNLQQQQQQQIQNQQQQQQQIQNQQQQQQQMGQQGGGQMGMQGMNFQMQQMVMQRMQQQRMMMQNQNQNQMQQQNQGQMQNQNMQQMQQQRMLLLQQQQLQQQQQNQSQSLQQNQQQNQQQQQQQQQGSGQN
ncbi:copine [Anaeramoeba flamelloides]|uniref:Copine n=1 Tax=Anaeramoeba flamelloides TaxID=1746091 RepID=A0ABQ8YCM8_9EUKA|nr:copine [Anaeramoeba flamelloides]